MGLCENGARGSGDGCGYSLPDLASLALSSAEAVEAGPERAATGLIAAELESAGSE